MIDRCWSARARRARLVLMAATLAVMAATAGFVWTAAAGAQPACTDDYTGPSGGDWGNNLNWSGAPPNQSSHNVPTATDVACVPSGTTVDVESNEGDEAESIQGGGNLTVDGGDLSLGNPYGSSPSNIGDLTLTGGLLNGGSMSMSGNFDWNVVSGGDSILDVVNGITQSGSGSFQISGSGTATDGGGAISTNSPVSISNETGLGSSSSDGANPSLTTTGVVTLAAGDYTGSGIPITAGGFDTAAGTTTTYPNSLTVTGDSSDLAGSLSLPEATFFSNAGSSLTVPSGIDLSPDADEIYGTITGAGTYTTGSAGTLVNSGGTLSTTHVDIPAGAMIVESGGDYAAGDGAGTGTTIDGGTLTSDSRGSAGTVDLTFSSGDLEGPGALAISGDFAWTGGTVSDSSPISLSQTGGGSFSISGIGYPDFAGGSITTTSPASINSGNLQGVDSSTLAAAGFDTSGRTELGFNLVQTGGTTDVPVGSTLTAPAFALQGGVLEVDGQLAGIDTASDYLTITGGTLEGSGTVNELVTNTSGTVSPGDGPGRLTLDYDYTQGSGATLAIAVDGTGAGDFSVLNVEGDVSLDGTLALQPSAGYAASAAAGDSIAFLPYSGSLSGTFASTTVTPPLQAGESFAPVYSNPNVVDAVVGAGSSPPAAPTVTGVNPSSGPTAGGTSVTIGGTGFTSGSTVSFGTNPASNVDVVSSTSITATSPAGSGTVDVTVSNTNGTSPTNAGDHFAYDSVPTVSSVSPSSGSTAGGTGVTIGGTGFTSGSTVSFGANAATEVDVLSSTSLTATSPAGSAGTVDVRVSTPGGTSPTNAGDRFTYIAPPPPTPTSTALSSSPTGPVTNQTVTLSATVTPSSPVPTGTVEFFNGGVPISGCTSETLALNGSGAYTATCQTSFAAASSPEPLSATFTSSNTSISGSSGNDTLAVGSDTTTTALGVSNATPTVGQNVTYTATVTPDHAGSTEPSGSVEFQDGAMAIGSCSSQPLSAGAASSSAACTLSYPAVGSHAITARYLADANFTGSTSSPAQTVTVQQPPPPPPATKPSNTSAPLASGTPTVGRVVSVSTGHWSGTAPISYTYQWQRCNPACVNIAGATGSSYTLPRADVGARILVLVTATNSAGSAQASSNKVGPVGPSVSQILAALSNVLSPHGKNATIAALLKHGGFTFTFTAPGAGTLVINWYFLPKGAHITNAKPKPVTIASARVRFTKAGIAKATVRLTHKGKQLLKHATSLKVTTKDVFTPTTGTTASKQKSFTLRT